MNTRSDKRKLVAVLVSIVIQVFACSLCLAQDKPADNMGILRAKLQADKKLLIAENMQLTEAEAKSFWPVYEDYQNELFLLQSRSIKLINDFAEAYENMTDHVARTLLDEYMTIEGLRLELCQAYLPKFRKVLPEKKVVRYYQLESKIQALQNYELARKIPLVEVSKSEKKSGAAF
ncbi:MAG: hypothetical protein ACLPX5_04415 [Dissulfurispiraceae bacterium]